MQLILVRPLALLLRNSAYTYAASLTMLVGESKRDNWDCAYLPKAICEMNIFNA